MAANSRQLEPGIERIVYQHISGWRVEHSEFSERKNEEIWKSNRTDVRRGNRVVECNQSIGMPWETDAVSGQVLCTPYNHAPGYSVTLYLGWICVTCHLHFWQNDRDLLRAAAVTRVWDGYRNNSQHRKLTLEKKSLPPPLLPGLEPETSVSITSPSGYHWATPAPHTPINTY